MTRWQRALLMGRIQWRLDTYFTAGPYAKQLDARYDRLEKMKWMLTRTGRLPRHYRLV